MRTKKSIGEVMAGNSQRTGRNIQFNMFLLTKCIQSNQDAYFFHSVLSNQNKDAFGIIQFAGHMCYSKCNISGIEIVRKHLWIVCKVTDFHRIYFHEFETYLFGQIYFYISGDILWTLQSEVYNFMTSHAISNGIDTVAVINSIKTDVFF